MSLSPFSLPHPCLGDPPPHPTPSFISLQSRGEPNIRLSSNLPFKYASIYTHKSKNIPPDSLTHRLGVEDTFVESETFMIIALPSG